MNVAREQGIHDRTLRHKWDQFVAERKKDIDEATVLIWCDMEHRGGHNSGLSLNNQLVLRGELAAAAVAGVPVHDADLSRRALTLHRNEQGPLLRTGPQFLASRAFAWRYKKKWRLDSRRPRAHPKPTVVDPLADAAYLEEVKKWQARVPPELFLNLDETAFRLANTTLTSIAPHGTRCRVIGGADQRHGFTMVLVVTANGIKLKPTFIKRGKTERAIKVLKAKYGTRSFWLTAERGWSNEDKMCSIIKHIIFPHTQGRQAVLLMDVYGGHQTPAVLACCRKHNLVPLWVPAGATATTTTPGCNGNGSAEDASARTVACTASGSRRICSSSDHNGQCGW
jgi:hypothetical protein